MGTFSNFKGKMDVLKFCSVAIGQEKGDRESLICGNLPTLDGEKIEQMSVEELWKVYEEVEQFSYSFVDKSVTYNPSIDDAVKGPVKLCSIDFTAL